MSSKTHVQFSPTPGYEMKGTKREPKDIMQEITLLVSKLPA